MKHARSDYDKRIQDAATTDPSLLLPGQQPIPEDEPVFLLRAQDTTAAETVRYWIELNEKLGNNDQALDAARRWHTKMLAWPKRKLADKPAGT